MKKALFLAVIYFISSPSFAYKIISEHQECHGNKGGECGFIHEDVSKKKVTMAPMSVGVIASASDQYGRPGQYIRIVGHHEIRMRNGDNHKKRYHYRYSLHCGAMSNSFDRDIELNGKEEFSDSGSSFGTVQA